MKYAKTKPVSTRALCWTKRRRKMIRMAAAPEMANLIVMVSDGVEGKCL
jgi:hypothetical protein